MQSESRSGPYGADPLDGSKRSNRENRNSIPFTRHGCGIGSRHLAERSKETLDRATRSSLAARRVTTYRAGSAAETVAADFLLERFWFDLHPATFKPKQFTEADCWPCFAHATLTFRAAWPLPPAQRLHRVWRRLPDRFDPPAPIRPARSSRSSAANWAGQVSERSGQRAGSGSRRWP